MYPWLTSIHDHVRCILATNNTNDQDDVPDSIHLIGYSDTLKAIQFNCNSLLLFGDDDDDGSNEKSNFQILFICRHDIDGHQGGIHQYFN